MRQIEKKCVSDQLNEKAKYTSIFTSFLQCLGLGKVKGNVPEHAVKVQGTIGIFLAWALDGGESSASRSHCSTPGKNNLVTY
jgi:hypothetical protein